MSPPAITPLPRKINNKILCFSNKADLEIYEVRKGLWAFFLDSAFQVLIGWAGKVRSYGNLIGQRVWNVVTPILVARPLEVAYECVIVWFWCTLARWRCFLEAEICKWWADWLVCWSGKNIKKGKQERQEIFRQRGENVLDAADSHLLGPGT